MRLEGYTTGLRSQNLEGSLSNPKADAWSPRPKEVGLGPKRQTEVPRAQITCSTRGFIYSFDHSFNECILNMCHIPGSRDIVLHK